MRNAEATRERILDAAMAEFAAYGIAGARVDRIAEAAGCNKNLIYIYFENKDTLFTTVLQKHLSRVYEDVPITPDDLPGYAARLFDFAMAHPELMRLMAWFGLERNAQGLPYRSASFAGKSEALAKAQQDGKVGSTFSPGFLITAMMTLATAWSAANPFGSLDPAALKQKDALRDSVAKAIEKLTEP
jgi:AcrR family transcriptional regulator